MGFEKENKRLAECLREANTNAEQNIITIMLVLLVILLGGFFSYSAYVSWSKPSPEELIAEANASPCIRSKINDVLSTDTPVINNRLRALRQDCETEHRNKEISERQRKIIDQPE